MLRLLRLQLVLVCITFVPVTLAIQWDHSAHLDDAFRLLWSVRPGHITFEMQVRTHGYVGLGFARNAGSGGGGVDEERAGADVVVGWVDRGQTYFQDRHFKMTGAVEPRIDPSEDYTLLLGYENVTHTVLRFERKTDTCDTAHDVVITVGCVGVRVERRQAIDRYEEMLEIHTAPKHKQGDNSTNFFIYFFKTLKH